MSGVHLSVFLTDPDFKDLENPKPLPREYNLFSAERFSRKFHFLTSPRVIAWPVAPLLSTTQFVSLSWEDPRASLNRYRSTRKAKPYWQRQWTANGSSGLRLALRLVTRRGASQYSKNVSSFSQVPLHLLSGSMRVGRQMEERGIHHLSTGTHPLWYQNPIRIHG